MNIPNTMMRNANSRRGSMRSDGGAAAFIMEGEAVVASAMICQRSVPIHAPGFALRRKNYFGWTIAGASRSASLSASAAPTRVSTVV